MPRTSQSLIHYLRIVVGAWRDDPRGDAELLAQFVKGGDETAFRVLVCRHGPLVWQTCRAILGDTPDAEDAFQATFLALARKAGRFPVESLAGWLYRVARQAALDTRASARRHQRLEHQLRAAARPVAEGDSDRAKLYAGLDAELAGLPERLRVPLLLHYLEGKSQVEVAHFLGCSRGVVQRRLARGETLLRERLERRGLVIGVGLVTALLTSSVAVSAMPVRLIGSTARAAVAFRSGTLTGEAAEAAGAVLRSLPPFLETTIMRKSLWFVLACVGFLGIGLAAWQVPVVHSDMAESTQLSTLPKASAEPGSGQVDRYGDPLPSGALARLGTLRLRHAGNFFSARAKSVIFSRDGKVLITAGHSNPIRLWDTATGKLLRSLGDHRSNPAVSIALSPNGRILVARNENGSVSLWEVATGKLLRRLEVDITALAFSRDGRTLLSAGQDSYLRVWEVATGKELRSQKIFLNADKAGSLCKTETSTFSPDGKTLAFVYNATGDTNIYLWQVASGKQLHLLPLGQRDTRQGMVTFSPDSRFLAVSSFSRDEKQNDGVLCLWEVATGREVRRWESDEAGTRSVAFSPNGKIIAIGSNFGPIRLYEAATGKELRHCQGYRANVVAMAFSPDSRILASVAGVNDHTVRLWEVASGKELVPPSGGHVGPVLSLAFSLDGKSLISGGRDGLIGLWNAETGQKQRPPLRAGDFQALAVLSADGKTIFSAGNIYSPKCQNPYYMLAQMPTQVCVWDRAMGQKLRQFQGPAAGAIQSLVLSPDEKILVLIFYGSVRLIEIATGKEMRSITELPIKNPNYAAFSPDGKTLALSLSRDKARPGTVHFYATATGEKLGSTIQAGKDDPVSCLTFSPNEQILAIGGQNKTIRLWRLPAGKKLWKEVGTLLGHQGCVWGLAFSPDGKTLASTSEDGTVRLWEVATGQERRRFVGHGGEAWCVTFAPDGRRLATGINDTTILLWDVTGRLQGGQLRPAKLSTQELKGLWADLAGADTTRAGQAVWTLAAAPAQALPLLREHLRPVAPAGPRIDRLITDLDSETFAVRQKATDELAKLGEVAEPAMRQALGKPGCSLEMRRRLKQLLKLLEEKFPLTGEELRSCRALEVLGQIGTPEAMRLLESLAQGEPEARWTLEAQAILKWLRPRANADKP